MANVPGNVQAGAPHEPDSHDMRLMRVREALQRDGQPPEVRQAVEVVRSLAARIGQVDPEDGLPRVTRRQQWSVFKVLFMLAAAAGDRSCTVLEWLAQSVRDVSIPVCGVEMPGHEAVMAGWEALHFAVNTMGIQSVEGLSEWIDGQGFPQPRWGAHFSGRAQERLLNSAAHINARVTSLESACVQAVL